MATTQYIGSRYVPLFADPIEWNNERTYEPLTIVTHGGNSYTSRQYVPMGASIDDTDYWVETGNYNAQVEQYRQEVKVAVNTVYDTLDEQDKKINKQIAEQDTKINNQIAQQKLDIEQQIANQDIKIQEDIAKLDAQIDKQSSDIDAKIEAQDTKINDQIDKQSADIDARIDAQDKKINENIDNQNKQVEQAISNVSSVADTVLGRFTPKNILIVGDEWASTDMKWVQTVKNYSLYDKVEVLSKNMGTMADIKQLVINGMQMFDNLDAVVIVGGIYDFIKGNYITDDIDDIGKYIHNTFPNAVIHMCYNTCALDNSTERFNGILHVGGSLANYNIKTTEYNTYEHFGFAMMYDIAMISLDNYSLSNGKRQSDLSDYVIKLLNGIEYYFYPLDCEGSYVNFSAQVSPKGIVISDDDNSGTPKFYGHANIAEWNFDESDISYKALQNACTASILYLMTALVNFGLSSTLTSAGYDGIVSISNAFPESTLSTKSLKIDFYKPSTTYYDNIHAYFFAPFPK